MIGASFHLHAIDLVHTAISIRYDPQAGWFFLAQLAAPLGIAVDHFVAKIIQLRVGMVRITLFLFLLVPFFLRNVTVDVFFERHGRIPPVQLNGSLIKLAIDMGLVKCAAGT
jgi:hypothetical protein